MRSLLRGPRRKRGEELCRGGGIEGRSLGWGLRLRDRVARWRVGEREGWRGRQWIWLLQGCWLDGRSL